MMPEIIYTVLTGDVVKSSSLSGKEREAVIDHVKNTIKSSRSLPKKPSELVVFSNIFRGDSFQGVMSDFSKALKVALFIRAEMIKFRSEVDTTDVRISLGIGKINILNKHRIEESDGEAFQISGRALDKMKRYRRLNFESSVPHFNNQLNTVASLLDALISRWTSYQAEGISLWLQHGTQEAISKKLDITQPAVQQRLQTAGLFAVEDALDLLSHSFSEEYKLAS